MSKRRKSIRILEHERPHLVELYLGRRIPVDQYENRSEELGALAMEWNAVTGRCDQPHDLLHYMRSQRKRKLWVTLDGNHVARPELPVFSAEETEILVAVYENEVAAGAHGSDEIAYDPGLGGKIAKSFANATGRILPAHSLVAKLTALRKRGLLPQAEQQMSWFSGNRNPRCWALAS